MSDWLKRGVSLGQLLNLAALVFAAAGFYWTTTLALERQTAELGKLRLKIAEVRSETQALRDKIDVRAERAWAAESAVMQRIAAVEAELRALRAEIERRNGKR